MSARFRLYPDAKKTLTNLPEVTEAVNDVATQISEEARANAPVGTGDYAAGIQVVESVAADGSVTRTVLATDPKSALIEYGTGPRENAKGSNRGEMPAFHVLGSAVDALGLRIGPKDQT